jgi:hypothetical protein
MIMVAEIIKIAMVYEERLRKMPYVPRFLYGRLMLRDDILALIAALDFSTVLPGFFRHLHKQEPSPSVLIILRF